MVKPILKMGPINKVNNYNPSTLLPALRYWEKTSNHEYNVLSYS
jgi:hypothetical protein